MQLSRTFGTGLLALAAAQILTADDTTSPIATIVPPEQTDAVLHNPDMGWVLYENFPVDQDEHGSSTLVTLPNEDFPAVDAVALMFSWQDVERQPDEYDFSKIDYAYDYWARRGKEIQLRLSATTLLWWSNRTPPAGNGAPHYVRAQLAPNETQMRELAGFRYEVEDARSRFYRARLSMFLRAVNEHFSGDRPVTLIDLRGFGVWGEWHSGFQYSGIEERRDALKTIIDDWTAALPGHQLALSYSYDPDGPKEFYAGPTEKYDEGSTAHYADFVRYSAFDYALAKPNITYRRDGCGGSVHSNERKFNEAAFRLGRGPMFAEFMDGYASSKSAGAEFVKWKIDDALSLHPNYVNVLGYQGGDMLAFLRERGDLVSEGMRRMGYRFVPTRVTYPTRVTLGKPFEWAIDWLNRGVGRALRDYELNLVLVGSDGEAAVEAIAGTVSTSQWNAGETYVTRSAATFESTLPREYKLAIHMRDTKLNRDISLPLANRGPGNSYIIGPITVEGGG